MTFGVVMIFPLSTSITLHRGSGVFLDPVLSFFERDELLCDLPTFLFLVSGSHGADVLPSSLLFLLVVFPCDFFRFR